jgi:hypothetical protein
MTNGNQLFFIVGAQRSGTTLLVKLLDENPQISIAKPIRPEPKFFLNEDWSNYNLNQYLAAYHSPENIAQASLFGEKSTSYYEIPQIPARIKAFAPNAKIVFLLRNPVDRALSNYFFSSANGIESRAMETVFLAAELDQPLPSNPGDYSVNPFNYLGRGAYRQFIQRYLEHFDESQLFTGFYDELTNRPKAFLQALSAFLGVQPARLSDSELPQVNASDFEKTNIPAEILEKLYRYYHKHNQKLETLIGKKVPQSWHLPEA